MFINKNTNTSYKSNAKVRRLVRYQATVQKISIFNTSIILSVTNYIEVIPNITILVRTQSEADYYIKNCNIFKKTVSSFDIAIYHKERSALRSTTIP